MKQQLRQPDLFVDSSLTMPEGRISNVLLVAIALYLLLRLITTVLTAYKRGLRDVPGPHLAKWSSLYRLKLVWSGAAHENYLQIHQDYGPIVRTAPNAVDISDPKVIPTIYGIASKYLKVGRPRFHIP